MLFAIALTLAVQAPPAFDEAVAEGAPSALSFELGGEGDLTGSPAIFPHGYVRVRYHDAALLDGLVFNLDYNTDALEVSLADPSALGGDWYSKMTARVQAFAANMSFDHTRDGQQDPSRAISSGYVLVQGLVARDIARRGEARFTGLFDLGARQWLHFRRLETAPEFKLPAPTTTLELGGTFLLETRGPDGPFRRRVGTYAAARGEIFARLGQASWGIGPRNDVDEPLASRGIFKSGLGVRAKPLLGMRPVFLMEGTAAAGAFLDDNTRFLLGGENIWVENLAGLGWAELHADRFAKAHIDAGVEIGPWAMLLVGTDLAMTTDPRRSGADDELGTILGTFVEVQSRPIPDVWLRLRGARAFGAQRLEGDTVWKVFFGLEWAPTL